MPDARLIWRMSTSGRKQKSAVRAAFCWCQSDVSVRERALNIAVVRADRCGALERSRNTVARRPNVRTLQRRREGDEHKCAKVAGTALIEPRGSLASIAFEATTRGGAAPGFDSPAAWDAADRSKLNAPRLNRESADAFRIRERDSSD